MDMLESLKSRGITQKNFPWKLDQMSDEEVTFMLDREPGKEQLDTMRKDPVFSDRSWAEFLRDF